MGEIKVQPIIQVKNLTKRYNKARQIAVNNISFDVQPGEFFALLGPNGAGKTTTISILTTTLSKTSGDITIAGYNLNNQTKDIRQNVGIVFQNPSLDLYLTAEENIRFHVSLYGDYQYKPTYQLMPQEYKTQVTQLADFLGIGEDLFKPLKTFSGGMKRKLEIIRSLMHKPKILFLDEPTQGLDAVSRRDLWGYLRKVSKEQKTTIFLTTHYIEEAEFADRVCIVNHGKIAFLGTPAEMKNCLMDNFLLLDAENRSLLASELRPFKTKITPEGKFKVHFDEQTPQHIFSQIKTPLLQLEIHTPSLEEAYMNLVDAKNLEAE
ncbi:MAG TPA: ABC transporter ATP-binding protein [Verrucomicrobiae bacterium]|nr:ABC transporter ATP-binding protein [Verrucomicrobiae bacterium]